MIFSQVGPPDTVTTKSFTGSRTGYSGCGILVPGRIATPPSTLAASTTPTPPTYSAAAGPDRDRRRARHRDTASPRSSTGPSTPP